MADRSTATRGTCSEDGCERDVKARGLCKTHYSAWHRSLRPPCSVDGCNRPKHKGTLCATHASRLDRRGEIGSAELERERQTGDCTVEGCDRPKTKRGLCSAHYTAHRITTNEPCEVAGCERGQYGNGLCTMHYKRQRKTGDVGGSEPLLATAAAPRFCVVAGCDRKHSRWGYCAMHYQRVRDCGDPGDANPRQAPNGSGTRRKRDGYIMVTIDGCQQLQHRVVMERMIGRPLEPFENVHHKNGIRHDNRPENLELWVKPQPCGQRPEDLAEWVVDHYPELVTAALERKTQLRLVV